MSILISPARSKLVSRHRRYTSKLLFCVSCSLRSRNLSKSYFTQYPRDISEFSEINCNRSVFLGTSKNTTAQSLVNAGVAQVLYTILNSEHCRYASKLLFCISGSLRLRVRQAPGAPQSPCEHYP